MLSTNWLESASTSDSLQMLTALALLECSRISSATLRGELEDLLKREDWMGILEYDLDYDAGFNVSDVIAARQCLGYFQKFEPLGELLNIDREERAFEKFRQSEARCKDTNDFFSGWQKGEICLMPLFDERLHAAKWKIAKILGECPQFSQLNCRLGPGASTSVKRRNAVPSIKLRDTLGISTNSLPYLPLILGTYPWLIGDMEDEDWCLDNLPDILGRNPWLLGDEVGPDIVHKIEVSEERARLEFVAKDALSKRSILVVPTLTSFVQLGIGEFMAERLRKNGIDISDQTLNQRLAAYGSMSGALATLDLSSASDTVSLELVRFLLPDDWFSLLNSFREGEVVYSPRGKSSTVISMEKFSAMGNGYTFPLETLIFFALIWAASPHHERGFLSAYGDDLVCASERAPEIMEVLEVAGFVINRKKSFWKGPFRESCGADFYFGINVRPYRQKSLVSGETAFTLHNFHKRRFDDECAAVVRGWIPPPMILLGPDGFGDGHLLSGDAVLRPHKRKDGWSGYTFETYARVGRKSQALLPGDHVGLLYVLYTRAGAPEKEYVPSPSEPIHILRQRLRNRAYDVVEAPLKTTSHGRLIKVFPGGSETVYARTKIYTLTPS